MGSKSLALERPELATMEQKNNVKKIREARMLSKAELARLAGISPLTLDRIEKGKDCRLATKRKILLALGLTIEQKHTLFKQ
jgi:DNA-binding XRE family transcriptional regulator